MRRTRTPALGLLAMLAACVLRWPDEPHLDTVDEIPKEAAAQLEARHPGARRATPVYRHHVEGRWGRDRIASQCFLVEDSRARVFRVEVDDAGAVRIHPATRVAALPEALRQAFFEHRHAVARGGVVSGPAWFFDDDRAGETMYEFEFTVDGRRGLGRISASGRRTYAAVPGH